MRWMTLAALAVSTVAAAGALSGEQRVLVVPVQGVYVAAMDLDTCEWSASDDNKIMQTCEASIVLDKRYVRDSQVACVVSDGELDCKELDAKGNVARR